MFSLILTACLFPSSDGERPLALVAFEQTRRALNANRIEWGAAPRGNFEKEITFTSRYAANGDMIFENRGDPEGWTRHSRQTLQGYHRLPQLYLVGSDGTWWYEETSVCADFWKRDGQPSLWDDEIRDVRGIGMFPRSGTMDFGKGIEAIWGTMDDPIVRWTEEQRDGIYVVTGENRIGIRITWHIDPDRGWNAERVVAEIGNQRWEAVSDLAQFGDTWFPAQTHYFEDGELTEVITLRSADLDHATTPPRFTPIDIGLEPGMKVSVKNGPRPVSGQHTWNGEQWIEHATFVADVKAGLRDSGPTVKAQHQRGYFDSPYLTQAQRERAKADRQQSLLRYALTRHNDRWVRYVREFITRYNLNTEQQESAWRIHKDCVGAADEVIQRIRNRLEEALNRRAKAVEEAKPDEQERADTELKRLREPIDRIFAERLQPRLDKLPTEAQRRAAEQRAGNETAPDNAAPKAPPPDRP